MPGSFREPLLSSLQLPPSSSSGLTALDWAVIAAYTLGMLAIGWYYHRRTESTESYLLGDRSMRPSSVGVSLFATLFSTITYFAIPGEMINKGPVILWSMLAIPIAYVVVGYFLIPPIMRFRATSAYEILESTLGLRIRLLGSCMFLLTRLLWMELIIYVTARQIIVTTMNWDASATPYVATVIGLSTVVYTTLGGLRAVVVADLIQTAILFAGTIASILIITVKLGGVSGWWPREWSATWDQQPIFSLDPTVRVTVVGSIVMMLVWWICTAGSDQMAIQRYLATRDARTARRVFLVTGLSNIVITLMLAVLGFALLEFFRSNPGLRPPGRDYLAAADELFPYFIAHFLPAGVTGLMIAALLSNAMDSLSGGINSASSVISVDFVDRLELARGPDTQEARIRRTRIIAFVSGLVSVALSLLMSRVSGNLFEVSTRTNHVFVAPLFGLFFMALFVPFATPFGTACGALASCAVAIVIAYWDMLTGGPRLSFQWITLFALLVGLGVGCLVSLLSARVAHTGAPGHVASARPGVPDRATR
jgi:SSS family solute:Na+ symporter